MTKTDPETMATAASPRAHVLIYEPRVEGHHVGYLKFVTDDLLHAGYRLSLAIDTRAEPLRRIKEQMADLLARVEVLDACDAGGRPAAGSKIATIAAYRERAGADLVFLPNFDEIASSMLRRAAFGLMPPATLRGRLSGIYHRPRLLPRERTSLNRWIKRRGFDRLLREGWISHLLLLDPYVLAAFKAWRPEAPMFGLADPYPEDFIVDRETARRAFDLPPDRRVFLFYGGAYRRKGLPLAVDAMLALPPDIPAFLLCAGQQAADAAVTQKLEMLAKQGRARVINRYVSTDEEKQLFAAADAVLLPYRRHFAGSGILVRAVGAQRPVIVSDEGLIGRLVREHGLGLLVPPGDAVGLRDAMARMVQAPPQERGQWQAAAQALAPHWSRTAFREALIDAFARRLPVSAR